MNADDRIDHLVGCLNETRLGKVLIELGILQDIQINLISNMDTAGYYSYSIMNGYQIDLNADCDDYTLFAALAHELRHAEQWMSLEINSIYQLPIEDAIILQRYMEADASAYSQAVLYERYEQTGDMKYLSATAEYDESDIQRAFIKQIHGGQDYKDSPKPYQSAFKQWFKKQDRIDHYDAALIEGKKAFNENFLSLIFNKQSSLTKKMISTLGVVGPDFNYLSGKSRLNLGHSTYTQLPQHTIKAMKNV